jgi:acyl-CoA reductase-like NAD-dependent aldehyde dehydrogenase
MKVPIHFETAEAVSVELDIVPVSEIVERAIDWARIAQKKWSATPVAARLKIFRRARALIAERAEALAHAANASRRRPLAEILTAEVLPLAEACRFLERDAEKILRPKKIGARGRPLWLGGVASEIHREPLGLILIIGPGNYPLFLPCVQALQALAAGNAVLLKPGLGGSRAACAFAEILAHAGLDKSLCQILPEDAEAASCAIQNGVDKVVLTGSATTGETVLRQCAKNLTPATVELSGCDAVFVRADADLDLVVRALAFGLQLNNSATCIAPRRVFVPRSLATELEGRLAQMFQIGNGIEVSGFTSPHWSQLAREALAGGAHLLAGQISENDQFHAPIIFAGMKPSMRLVQEDIFAPVLSLITVADDDEALAFAAQCPFALGATIFSRDETAARSLATRVRAGVVVINDLIVPTADPRLPFGGRGRSGFGVTRGAEGLLEMTAPKVVSVRSGKSRRHFDEPHPSDAELFTAYIQAAHTSGWRNRFAAFKKLFSALKKRSTKTDRV